MRVPATCCLGTLRINQESRATVRKADVIYVLEDGRIAEAGKHQELLARGGLYSQLYDIQFKNQEVEAVIEEFASTVH